MDPNPFDLEGPEFLWLYVFFLLLTVGAAAVLRRQLREPTDGGEEVPHHLDPYEVAYLAGKSALAVNAALANLVHQDLVSVSASDRLVTARGKLAPEAHPLEEAVYNGAVRGAHGRRIGEVRQDA